MKDTKVAMVIMSHLSDAQECTFSNPAQANRHINFAKYLILKYHNTDIYIDANKEYEDFCNVSYAISQI